MNASIAASTSSTFPVASRSSSSPRVTAMPKPRVRPGHRPWKAASDAQLRRRIEPAVDDPVEQLGRMRSPLKRLPVDLEEQPLVRPQRRIRDVLPPRTHRLVQRRVGVGKDLGERVSLSLLDGTHDLHPQALLRSEVVDQHPVAGTERGGERSQAQVAEAGLGDVRDRAIQQLLPCVRATHLHR